jgi:hypothetical protein
MVKALSVRPLLGVLALCLIVLGAGQSFSQTSGRGSASSDPTPRELSQRIDTLIDRLSIEKRYQDEAREKAFTAMADKLEGMNNLRHDLAAVTSKFEELAKVQTKQEAFDARIKKLEEVVAADTGRSGITAILWSLAGGSAITIFTAGAVFMLLKVMRSKGNGDRPR